MKLLNSRRHGVRILGACSIALMIVWPAIAQDRMAEVDALAAKSDPLQDDWTTEKLHVHAKHQLKALGKQLADHAANGADFHLGHVFAPGAEFIRPSTFKGRRIDSGRALQVSPVATESGTPHDRSIVELMKRFTGAKDLRFAAKVIHVSIKSEDTFDTDALIQVFGTADGNPQQKNAEWKIAWRRGEDPDHPLIERISVSKQDDVSLTSTAFTEATTSIIPSDRDWNAQIRPGGEYWFGRVDAVGELNYLGHQGIAVGDANGDGLDDLYVALGTGLPNKLYIRNPDGTVQDKAHDAGVAWLDDTKGVLFVDIDNDGDQDLISAMGPTILLSENDGSGRFTPARRLRAASEAAFYSLAAADYDLDGDLDIYAVRYVKARYGQSIPVPYHDANNGPPNHLLRNDGANGFTDVTREAGLAVNNARFSLAASWFDYDRDGDPDLYVANDFGRNNFYRNDGGHFTDIAADVGAEDQAAGMGISWSDYDLDGDIDVFVSNMFSSAGQRIAYQPRFKQGEAMLRATIQHHSLGNTLLANVDGGFRDVSDHAGVRMGRWAWGGMFADINNDGYDDMIVPNGFLTNELNDDL